MIEDAALAIGSRAGSHPVGAAGDLVSFSFHPNKNLTTIEGGALVVNDEAEAKRVEEIRFHGIKRLADGTRDVEHAGAKLNLSDVSARLEPVAKSPPWIVQFTPPFASYQVAPSPVQAPLLEVPVPSPQLRLARKARIVSATGSVS